jgi:hypothetical protein
VLAKASHLRRTDTNACLLHSHALAKPLHEGGITNSWPGPRSRYQGMLERARTHWDLLNFVQQKTTIFTAHFDLLNVTQTISC